MGNVRLGFLAAIVGLLLSIFASTSFAHRCDDRYFGQERYSLPQGRHQVRDAKQLTTNPNLKVATWNLLNFKIDTFALQQGKLPYSKKDVIAQEIHSKSYSEVIQYVKAMEQMNADILILQEAVGTSVKFLVKKFMNDEYIVISDKTRKDTEIQTLVLVRRHLNVDFETQSFNHLKWRSQENVEMPLFSNGMFTVFLKQRGTSVRPSEAPDMVVIGTHYKSSYNKRAESEMRRAAQMQTTAKIIQSIDSKFNRTPLLLAGDFNTDPVSSREAEPLRFLLKDSLQSSGKSGDRYTFEHHNHGHVSRRQLDGQMMNETLTKKLSDSYVYRFGKGQPRTNGNSALKPQPVIENPSDHMPVVAEYDMTRE